MSGLASIPAAEAPVSDPPAETMTLRAKRSSFAVRIAAGIWLAVVIGAGVALSLHGMTAGSQPVGPARWPTSSQIVPGSNATLLVFVHPYCPCTRATLGELERLMATCGDEVSAQVIFVLPEGENPNWEQNELWQSALAIPHVRPVVDVDGHEAKRFGARTSGFTLLFAKDGTNLYSGGITISRGHAGDNIGRQAIASLLAHEQPAASSAPTFGCALIGSEAMAAAEDRP